MATNYTTKTAALRATKADMRQVQVSKKIEIGKSGSGTTVSDKEIETDVLKVKDTREGSETYNQRTDIMSILSTLKSGVDVHADADGDYVADKSGVTTGKINFLGAYVNVVDDGENGVNVYIGENNNNPSYSSITDTLANTNYVYASSTSAYALPSDATAGSTYARTSSLTGTETVSLNGGATIGNILADQTITVTVTSDKGTISYTTGKISEQAGTTAASKNYTWEDDYATKGIKVAGTALIKYAAADAKNGYTPNSTTGIFVVTIDNDKVVGANGGWYSVSVKLGNTTKSTSKVFVYPNASTTPSVGKPVITYTAGGTRHVSGLVYDSSGSFTLTVDNIAGTQQGITKDLNRLALTDNGGDVDFSGTIETSTTGMSVTGTATNETAVYKYTATKSASVSTPKKVSAKISAQAYGQTGAVAGTKVASDTTTATTWLYTSTNADGDLTSAFHVDGKRIKNNLADVKAGNAVVTYDSTKSLIADYTDQLLIQGGQLKYPNSDSTQRYSGATGTRYYVRPVKFGGSGQINEISVTVSGLTAFNNSNMRIYLVKKGVADAQVLNWFKTAACSYGKPIANATAPSSNKWTCSINNDVYQLVGGVADTYYLVVEMVSGASAIGAITLA